MNVSYLRSFYTAVKFASISGAADYLHFTEPGLSMQIKSLEKEIGVRLLDRSSRGVKLTEGGEVVYKYARDVLSLSDKLTLELKNLRSRKSSLLICACKSIDGHILLQRLYAFKEANRNIDIAVETFNSETVMKKLLEHDVNIGVITGVGIPRNITASPIMRDNLILVGPRDLGRDVINLDELASLPLILRERGSGILALLSGALSGKGLSLNDLNILISLNSMEMIKSSLLSGKGCSFLPASSVRKELRENALKSISVRDFSVSFDYYVAFRDHHLLDESEKQFVSFLTRNIHRMGETAL